MAEGYSNGPSGAGRGRGGARGGRGNGSSRGRGGANAGRSQPAEQGAIPAGSVSKLKAQIRQTKRLLARDDLTPDVRTTTERRMVALESELEKTSQSKVEKKMVQRYRGVKFFERQKLLRKIKQAKKQLEDVPESADAQRSLREARVDLYYVLRYPKTEKYIALFPDGTYVPPITSLASLPADAPASERKRQQLRLTLREKIESGALPEEAELGELGIEGEEDVGSGPAERKRERATEEAVAAPAAQDEDDESQESRPAKRSRAEPPEAAAPAEDAIGEDAPTEGAPKKENRKQRKERKRAEAEAGSASTSIKSEARTQSNKSSKGGKASGKRSGEEAAGKSLAAEDDFFA